MKQTEKPNKDMTLEQWLNHWYETYARRSIKRSTAISYQGYITNHIVPQIGLYGLSELDTDILQQLFNYLCDEGNLKKTGKGLCPKTLRSIKNMLHKALDKAVELELIKKNYTDFVDLPSAVKPEMRVLSVREQELLTAELKCSRETYAFAVTVSLNLGLRLGEVLGLKWCDIDLRNKNVYIRRTLNRLHTLDGSSNKKTELVVDTPKTQTSIRQIPINDLFCSEIVRYHSFIGKKRRAVPKENDFLFKSTRGDNPADPKTVADVFKRIARAAGIEESVNFHCLRHTFATRAVERGVDVKTLSVILGHASVDITLNRYVHVLEEQKRKTMDILLSPLPSNDVEFSLSQ